MAISILSVLSQNITLVYDALNPQDVDVNKLKGVVGSDLKPMIMDTPEMIVAVFPPDPIVVQIGDRRIRATLPKPMQDIGKVPLWTIAPKCHRLARGSSLTAFGFNYDILVGLGEGTSNELSTKLCISSPKKVEAVVDGQLISVTPRIRFKRDQARYDLLIEPKDTRSLQVHLNTHFETPDNRLPDSSRLRTLFRQGFSYLTSTTPKLLAMEEW